MKGTAAEPGWRSSCGAGAWSPAQLAASSEGQQVGSGWQPRRLSFFRGPEDCGFRVRSRVVAVAGGLSLPRHLRLGDGRASDLDPPAWDWHWGWVCAVAAC